MNFNIKQISIFFVFVISLLILVPFYASAPLKPKISIITSVFKGDKFIASFLEEIVKQTIFDQCELIMINANSPGNEEKIIFDYMKKYKNIVYLKLPYDPGLYGVWNMAIKIARGIYVTNANLDDRVAYNCYEEHAKSLDKYLDVDLVYSDLYITNNVNLKPTDIDSEKCHEFITMPEFSLCCMKESIPNDHPMWRKSCHDRCGYFDEQFFAAGDFDMWLRFIESGGKFKKVNGVYGIHYDNPKGLSTNRSNHYLIAREVNLVKEKHKHFFQSIVS